MAIQERQDHGRTWRSRGAVAPRRASATRRPGRGRSSNGSVMGCDAETLAAGLGWFSIGLGLAELVAPKAMAQLIGVPDDETNRRILQGFGVREIASGV